MKKKIYSGAFALALLVAAIVGVQESKKNDVLLNDLALTNVEALANGESGGGGYDCCNTCDKAFCGTFYPEGGGASHKLYWR